MREDDKRIRLYLVLMLLLMVFIFVQSALPAETSQKESDGIVLILAQFLKADAERVSFAVRKTAHFTEYLFLGLAAAGTMRGLLARSGAKARSGNERKAQAGKEECQAAGIGRRAAGIGRRAAGTKNSVAKAAGLAWMVGTLYAVSDEVHQFFVPGRSCEVRDMVIDSCGVAAGVLIMLLVQRVTER